MKPERTKEEILLSNKRRDEIIRILEDEPYLRATYPLLHLFEGWLKESQSSPVESKWVRVDEGLPDLSSGQPYSDGKTYDHPKAIKVLAFSPSTIGQTTAYYWGARVDDPLKGWSLMGVTHWQPLPELPPIEETKEK